MRWAPRSLRARLVLIFTLGMSSVLLLSLLVLFAVLDKRLESALDEDLVNRSADLQALLEVRDHRAIRSDPLAQLYAADGRLLAGSPALRTHRLLSPGQVRAVRGRSFTDTSQRVGSGTDDVPLRLLSRRIGTSGDVLTVAVSSRVVDRLTDNALVLLVVAAPLLIGVATLGGWLVVRAALRPVDQLTREAAAISSPEDDRQLPVVPGDDEIARLAGTLSDMLDRLRVAFAREREFVDDASHELRTPIAVLRGELELALTALDDPAEVEQSLRAAQEQAVRLTRLSEDLLLLARERAGIVVVARAPVDLTELVRTEARALRTVFPLEIRTAGAPVIAEADGDRLRQVLRNLAANSAAAGATTVRATVADGGGGVFLEWADDGEGFPADVLGAAFDRFVRGDTARTSGTGAGLGLSIVRAIVTAHGGTVDASNGSPLGGAVVTLRLPAGPPD